METDRCYICRRTAAEVAKVFESDIAEEKQRWLQREKVREDEPNPFDVYTEDEYQLAKACQQLAPALLPVPLDQYEEKRDSLATKYKGIETIDQLLQIPVKKNPSGSGVRQKMVGHRINEIVQAYERAREVDRIRSEKRRKVEESFNALPEEVEWVRGIPVRLRISGGQASPASLAVTVPVCIVCSAWEPDLSAAKNRQCPV